MTKTIRVSTQYISEDAVIERRTYPNGSTALCLDGLDGEHLAVATVALEQLPAKGNVFIKDWSENTGMLACLQDAGVIGDVVRVIPTGFVVAHEVPLLLEFDNGAA
jgi:hypothetical protein